MYRWPIWLGLIGCSSSSEKQPSHSNEMTEVEALSESPDTGESSSPTEEDLDDAGEDTESDQEVTDTAEEEVVEDTAVEDTEAENTDTENTEEVDSGAVEEEEEVEECPPVYDPDPFADAVISYSPGDGAGFGQDDFPDIVLGPPMGMGTNAGSLDVLSLGENGEIILELTDWIAIDGDGADIIVFENPFVGWVEPGLVAASEDGSTWFEWPCDLEDVVGNYPGCAGTTPVQSHPDNCINACDPEEAGGNAFDLNTIGLEQARFIRIRDSGIMGPGGFDLDAISVVNGASP